MGLLLWPPPPFILISHDFQRPSFSLHTPTSTCTRSYRRTQYWPSLWLQRRCTIPSGLREKSSPAAAETYCFVLVCFVLFCNLALNLTTGGLGFLNGERGSAWRTLGPSLCTSLDSSVSFQVELKCRTSPRCVSLCFMAVFCLPRPFLLCFSLNAAAAAKRCIQCISKDCPQSALACWRVLKRVACVWGVRCF